MPSTGSLLAFIAAALVILLIPGPGVLYVVTRSIGQGYRAGLVSAVGLSAGALVHVGAATVGVSAALLASAQAFGVIKALGAGYLIYLGLTALFGRHQATHLRSLDAAPLRRVLVDGIVVSVFNPKIAVFFLAFLPQFVEPARGPAAGQVLLLGLIYCALALLTDSAYALIAGKVRYWFSGRVCAGPLPRYLTAGIYFGLGAHTALSGRRL